MAAAPALCPTATSEVKAGAVLGLQVVDLLSTLLPRVPHGHCHRSLAQALQHLHHWQEALHRPLCHVAVCLHAEQAAAEDPGQ